MKRWLQRAFDIRDQEFRLVQAFFFFFVGIGAFYTVGATVGDTLFLSSLSQDEVPTMLPWVYAGIAVASFLVTIIYDALQGRLSRLAMIVGTQVVLAASVLAFRVVIELDLRALYFALVIWMEVCALLSITLFFSFAGDYFSSRDARRLYGFIVGGMALGTVVAGYATSATVSILGTRNLLYVGSALLAFNAFTCWRIYRFGTPVPIVESEEDAGTKVSLKAIFERPYVRLLALMIPLAIVTTVMVDYQMKWIASTKSEQELAQFFGTFWALVGVAQLIFQFVFVPRLLSRLGIINCLVILPLMIILASSVLLAGSGFAYFGFGLLLFSAATNFLRIVLTETLDLPSREMLFLPLPTRLRVRAQPFLNGTLASLARGLGGVVLIVLFSVGVGVEKVSLVAVACSLMMILTLLKLRPKYRETLGATLRAYDVDACDLTGVIQSDTVDPMLEELLRSSDPAVVQFTLSLLAQRPIGGLAPVLGEMLGSADSSIAVEVLSCYGAHPDAAYLPPIRRSLEDGRGQVREAAVLALCRTSSDEALALAPELLEGKDRLMRNAAIVGLARFSGARGRERVRSLLDELAASEVMSDRAEAAELLGAIAQPGYVDLFSRLVTDDEPTVQHAALDAAAATGDAALTSLLLEAVADPELKAAAFSALSTMPQESIGQLAERLTDPAWPIADRRVLTRVISRIGGAEAAQVLWRTITETDQDLIFCHYAANSLRSLRINEGLYNLKLKGRKELTGKILDRLELLDRALEELGETDFFVSRVYGDHARLSIELALSLLSLKYDPRQIDRILFNLFADAAPMRARALELLDEVLPRRLAHRVISVIQPFVEHRQAEGSGLSDSSREQLLGSEPWIKVVTAYHLSDGDPESEALAQVALSEEDQDMFASLDMLSLLLTLPLFAKLSANYLVEQTSTVALLPMEEGSVLFEQGDEGDALYVLSAGEARVLVNDTEVATLGQGDIIGEMALLEDQPRSATVELTSEALIVLMGADSFGQLLMTQPAISRSLMKTLDTRIRDTQARAEGAQLPQEPPRQRMTQAFVMDAPDLQRIIPIISFLGQVDLFKNLPLSNLTRLAGIVQEVTFAPGEELFQQGDVGDALYLIRSGDVDVIVDGRKVASMGPNSALGDMALIGGVTRSATCSAAADAPQVRMYRLWADDFNQMLDTEPDVSLALLKTLSSRLRAVSHRRLHSLIPGPRDSVG